MITQLNNKFEQRNNAVLHFSRIGKMQGSSVTFPRGRAPGLLYLLKFLGTDYRLLLLRKRCSLFDTVDDLTPHRPLWCVACLNRAPPQPWRAALITESLMSKIDENFSGGVKKRFSVLFGSIDLHWRI